MSFNLISNRHFSFFEFLQTFFNYLKLVNQIQPTKAVVHLQLGLFSLSNHLLITYTQNYQIFLKFHKYNNEIVILPSCFYLPNISHKILTFKMSKHYWNFHCEILAHHCHQHVACKLYRCKMRMKRNKTRKLMWIDVNHIPFRAWVI